MRKNGHTAYYSMRGKDYKGALPKFAEKVLYKVMTEDKYEPRWEEGMFVGKIDQTDELILLTTDGVQKSRSYKPLEKIQKFDSIFLSQVKGLPWKADATMADSAKVIRGDPLTAGNRTRAMKITKGILQKYGRTEDCPACGEWGPLHSTACRIRIEKAMIAAGEAFETEERKQQEVTVPGENIPVPATPLTSRAPSKETAIQEGLIGLVAVLETPQVELWRDWKAWNSARFPRDKLTAGRQREVDNLFEFDAVEDCTLEDGEQAYDFVWVEDWRGPDVRSRLALRQFKSEEGKRFDVFAATPDAFFLRWQLWQLRTLSTNKEHAALIVDIACAYMHARRRGTEKIKVKVPPGVPSTTGYWLVKNAVNGLRESAQDWSEFVYDQLSSWGASRNDYNPCIYRIEKSDVEQHGDDFFCSGPRDIMLWLKSKFEESFKVKKTIMISLHPDDESNGDFLHRNISVDWSGWHETLDTQYVKDLVQNLGLENAHPLKVPGYKDAKLSEDAPALSKIEHTEYRAGGRLLQYIVDRRVETAFACKEILRQAHAPTSTSMTILKCAARFLKGAPKSVQDFFWIEDLPRQVDVYVDSDWAGGTTSRKSTSGGCIVMANASLKQW